MAIRFLYLFYSLAFLFNTVGAVNKQKFYSVLSGSSLEQIQKTITLLEQEPEGGYRNAYLGTLYMKSADLIESPADKLSSFKKGKNLLEEEIEKDTANIELRFLRFIIQEKAPLILKYNGNLEEDKKMLMAGYRYMHVDVLQAFREYIVTSANFTDSDRDQIK